MLYNIARRENGAVMIYCEKELNIFQFFLFVFEIRFICYMIFNYTV